MVYVHTNIPYRRYQFHCNILTILLKLQTNLAPCQQRAHLHFLPVSDTMHAPEGCGLATQLPLFADAEQDAGGLCAFLLQIQGDMKACLIMTKLLQRVEGFQMIQQKLHIHCH